MESLEQKPSFRFLVSAAQAGHWNYVDEHLAKVVAEGPAATD